MRPQRDQRGGGEIEFGSLLRRCGRAHPNRPAPSQEAEQNRQKDQARKAGLERQFENFVMGPVGWLQSTASSRSAARNTGTKVPIPLPHGQYWPIA